MLNAIEVVSFFCKVKTSDSLVYFSDLDFPGSSVVVGVCNGIVVEYVTGGVVVVGRVDGMAVLRVGCVVVVVVLCVGCVFVVVVVVVVKIC